MNPLVVISALFASALAAPAPGNYAAVAPALAPGYAAAPVLAAGYAAGPAWAAGYAAGPVVAAAAPVLAAAPAPHVTQTKAADVTTLHKPAPVVSKQTHFGQTSYISGYTSQILKPAIPDFKIAVPTALKGTQTITAPQVTVQKEIHTVNEPVHVEKPYNVPYHVIKPVEKIVEVPTPYPVAGEPIINKVQGAPIVRDHHHAAYAAPALAHAGYAAAPLAA